MSAVPEVDAKKRRDVLVIGGGPAGSAASIQIARLGRHVTLVEKTTEPHDKVCGEFLSGESANYLHCLGIDLQKLGAFPVSRIRVAGNAVWAEQRLPFPAWSLSRRNLDEALLLRVKDEGVNLIRGNAVETLDRERTGWSVHLSDGVQLLADDVFLATGKQDLRGWARGPGRQDDLVAFKMQLRLAPESTNALKDSIELIAFNGGYAGLQLIQDGIANLSFVITRTALRESGSQWPALQARLQQQSAHLTERLRASCPLLLRPLAASSIPYGFQLREAPEGLWAIGDQAAVIPSFTGDGIAIALHSAFVAAREYSCGASSSEFQRRLAYQLRSPMRLATLFSRGLVAVPQVLPLLRYVPGLIAQVAKRTRIPTQYLEMSTLPDVTLYKAD